MNVSDRLLTLDEAGELVRRTPRALRALIHTGKLPASKVGRGYLISAGDLVRLFSPTLAPVAPSPERVSPTARAVAQLAHAGFVGKAGA